MPPFSTRAIRNGRPLRPFKLDDSPSTAPGGDCSNNQSEPEFDKSLNVELIERLCAWKIAALQTKVSNESLSVPRPFIKVQSLPGVTTNWLYDTGAKVTVLALREFRKIPVEKRPVRKPSNVRLESASTNVIRVVGEFELPITVNNHTIKHNVLVVDNINSPAIMGIDLIDKLGISYNSRKRIFTTETSEPVFTTAALSTLASQIIPAFAVMPIRLSSLTTGSSRPGPNLRSMATIISQEFPLLSGGPGLVVPNHAGHVTVLVQNCGPTDMEIPRGVIVGELENIHNEILQPLNSANFHKLFPQKAKANIPLISETEKRQFLADLTLNVPESERKLYEELILANHDIFSKDKNDLGHANNFEHHIQMKSDEPIYRKQFQIPDAHKHLLESQVKEWLKLGVIQPSKSRYNSPMFLVPKKDGSLRVVQDFRALNANSHDDRYSMKDVSECIGDIGKAGSTIFSTLDLTSGFWQMPLTPESRHLTAFSVPGIGQFEWTMSPMGLLGCPASFQRLVEAAVHGLSNVIVYIDDLLIHTSTHPHHRQQLQQLFDKLRNAGLKVNLKKCEFGATNVSYLGFRLTPNGILPGADKLKAVKNTPPPANVHQVRQFLGLCNFFRTHVRNFSQVSGPLNRLTRKDTHWKGGPLPPDALQAYQELKQALVSEPIVAYPRQNRPYSLIVDAATGGENTDGGLGAILCQLDESGNHRVIAYASRALIKHEKNYTPFLLEMMAAVWGMEHFSTHLRGRKFTLFTDHRPLEKLGTVHSKTLNRLQQAMTEFDFVIQYKKGEEMPADFLSRNVCEAVDVFTPDLPQLQNNDPLVQALRKFTKEKVLPDNISPQTQQTITRVGNECFLENDILWRRINKVNGIPRTVLVVPQSLRDSLIQEAHGTMLSGHEGITKTKERLLHSYYWPNMEKDITVHLQTCQKCQVTKKQHSAPHLLSPLPQCTAPNQRVHIDLFGPLMTSEHGKKMVLCMTDAFTKYVELVALPNKEAGTTGSAIFSRWICRFGTPLEIVSDNGKEFCNELSKELYKLMGVEHTTTTPYHPQCNAQAEVCNKTIQKYLASFVDKSTLDWEMYLAPLAFSYNTSLHRSTKATPYFLTYGLDARAPSFPNPDIQRNYGESQAAEWFQTLQLARQIATHQNMILTNRAEHDHNRHAHPYHYVPGQMVWLDEKNFLHKNRKLAANWTGPYPITKVTDHGVVTLQKGHKNIIVNVDRIKPYVPPGPILRQMLQDEKPKEPEKEDPTQNEWTLINRKKQKMHPQNNTDQVVKQTDRETQETAPQSKETNPDDYQTAPSLEEADRDQYLLRFTTPAAVTHDAPNYAGRMTRARARAQQRASLSFLQAKTLVETVNRQAENWRKNILWYTAPTEGPSFVCDQYGLPVVNKNGNRSTKRQTGSTVTGNGSMREPEWVYKRRNFLKNLSVADRNLTLTGDPGFAFDPVAYDLTRLYPDQLHHYPDIHRELDYIPPPARAAVPIPVPPEPVAVTPPRTPSPPPRLPTPGRDSPDSDPEFHTPSGGASGGTPTPRGRTSRTPDNTTPARDVRHLPTRIWSPETRLWVEEPETSPGWHGSLPEFPDMPSDSDPPEPLRPSSAWFNPFSSSSRVARSPLPGKPTTTAQTQTRPAASTTTSQGTQAAWLISPPSTRTRSRTRPTSTTTTTTTSSAPTFTTTSARGRGIPASTTIPPGSDVRQGVRVGDKVVVLPPGYEGRPLRPGERLQDLPPGSSVLPLPPDRPQSSGKSVLPGFFFSKKK